MKNTIIFLFLIMATLTMNNKSPFKVDLYVSGEYKCTANSGESCKTRVSSDVNHTLSAKVDGEEVTSQRYNFEDGEVRVWTLKFKPNQ